MSRSVKDWHALLLIYRELDVRLRSGGRRSRFHHCAPDQEISDAMDSFRGFPNLARELASDQLQITYDIKSVDRSLCSLSLRNSDGFWPSPDDSRPELDLLAPRGKFDSIFLFWPQHDFAHESSVPGSAWGLGMGASAWSNGATYAAVANAPSSSWKAEAQGEVWLHEWLHGVCHHFAQRGLAMPQRDADGAELHGYVRSPTFGWSDYYRDLMNGNVVENGKRLGITLAAWQAGDTLTA